MYVVFFAPHFSILINDAKWATWNEIDELVNEGKFIKHRWEFVSEFLKKEIEI